MQETKTIKCETYHEGYITSNMQCFGWSLMSSQDVTNSDVDVDSDSQGNIYVRKTEEKYVKLVFQRDTSMPHYREITSLEYKYAAIVDEDYVAVPRFNFGRFLLIVPTLGISLMLFIMRVVKRKNKNKAIAAQNDEKDKQRRDIAMQAKALLE